MRYLFPAVSAIAILSSPAGAKRPPNFEPLPGEEATIGYLQGIAIIDLRRDSGAVQVTPLGLDHGRLTFDVAVLNLDDATDNFRVKDMCMHQKRRGRIAGSAT